MVDRTEDYLLMSGLQHFVFCRRQWALIHLEQQWKENSRTAEGHIEHGRVHDEFSVEKRGDLLVAHGMRVISHRLQLVGECDAVEFRRDPGGITLNRYPGTWVAMPIEYKHGHVKETDADRVQLCAQTMALEEMLVCSIPQAALFYEETHRREIVELTSELREKTQKYADEMRQDYRRGHTPKVKPGTFCNACSLKELCLPGLCSRLNVRSYIRNALEVP